MIHPFVRAVRVPRVTLAVAPDETVYAGEMYMAAACGFKDRIEVRDQQARDLEQIQHRNPDFATRTITKRLAVNDVAFGASR
jgi:hypothetical protein